MDRKDQLIDAFIQELLEALELVDDAVVHLEKDPASSVAGLFRVFHSLKASASLLHFGHFSTFSHQLEELLARMRGTSDTASSELIHFFFFIEDILKEFSGKIKSGYQEDDFLKDPAWLSKIQTAKNLSNGFVKAMPGEAEFQEPVPEKTAKEEQEFLLKIDFDPQIFLTGADPLIYIRDLHEKFSIVKCKASTKKLPPLQQLAPETYYLSWNITLWASSEEAIREVFFFLDEEKNRISIEPASSTYSAFNTSDLRVQDFLRVRSRKLDELLNLFGEMVIGFSQIRESVLTVNRDSETGAMLEKFSNIMRDFQGRIMDIRMISLAPLFHQFFRFIREGADYFNKKVDLEIQGEETELDKTIVDKISEPIKHLIRNCIDHGIEEPGERVAAGKEEYGKISLKAEHREGSVFIVVEDDGRGMNQNSILNEALKQGLVSQEESMNLSDDEIYDFIFHPGFSTRKTVNQYSGRGVGMDVVKQNIESLRGSIEIKSEVDKGSRFEIRLPLTLSIIEAIIFKVGSSSFAVPVNYIKEMAQDKNPRTNTFEGQLTMLYFRDKYYPVFYLDEFFSGMEYQHKEIKKGYLLLIEIEGENFFIFADSIVGEQQIVLKRIPQLEKYKNGIMGSSVLGNGEILFILDIFVFFHHILKQKTVPLPGKEQEAGLLEASENLEYS